MESWGTAEAVHQEIAKVQIQQINEAAKGPNLRMLLDGDVHGGSVAARGQGCQIGGHAGQRRRGEGDCAIDG